ncbi:MAG: hypothetical protein GVY12_14285 [Bacteroidetes bacterium]|jgi:hypothetical protein|nr:hypothetical protein [Bacteroidota bacterium]
MPAFGLQHSGRPRQQRLATGYLSRALGKARSPAPRWIVSALAVLLMLLAAAGPLHAQTPEEAPSYLFGTARDAFEAYRAYPNERAFAVSPEGAWGYTYRHETLDEARAAALANCRAHASRCTVIAENHRVIEPAYPFASPPAAVRHETSRAFPPTFARSTLILLALVGFMVLLFGVTVAERYPITYHFIFLPRTNEHYYLNWTLTPFSMVYLACMGPVFLEAVNGGLIDAWSWMLFVASILPLCVAPLYLNACGALVHRRSE